MSKYVLLIDGPNVALKYISLQDKINVELSFLKQISNFYQQFKPKDVFICWEGTNSRKLRQNILKEYKMNRHKPTNQRRSAKKASKLSVENIRQYITLFKVKLLENLPIRQLNVNNLEADDVIAELTRVYKDDNVIIISADADFQQLISENVSIYNHLKKVFITKENIKDKIANPFNLIWEKAIVGDKSDNIAGIKGVGPKTFAKIFKDNLLDEKRWSPDFVKEKLIENDKEYDKVMTNFKVIQLFVPLHALASAQIRDFCRAKKTYKLNEEFVINYFKTFKSIYFTKEKLKLILIPFNEFLAMRIFQKDI